MGKTKVMSTYRINASNSLQDRIRQIDFEINELINSKRRADQKIKELKEEKNYCFTKLKVWGII
jgi:hypothetical protein